MKIQKRDDQSHIRLGSGEQKYPLSSTLVDESGSKDFIIHHEIIESGIRTSAPHFHKETDEFVYVLKGTVIAHEGDKAHSLSAGDSVLFKANSKKSHFIENVSEENAEVLVVKRNLSQKDVKYSKGKKKKKFEKSATTSELLNVFKVRNKDGVEKVVQITYSSRLLKLANFIFHIFDVDPEESDFEFSYNVEGAKSYGGYSSFRLPKKDTPLPPGVGNMRHARIDSAFFPHENDLVLKVDNHPSEKFIVQCLRHEEPKPRRKYPYEVKLTELSDSYLVPLSQKIQADLDRIVLLFEKDLHR